MLQEQPPVKRRKTFATMSRKYLRTVIRKESNESPSISIRNESPLVSIRNEFPPISITNESPTTSITPQTCNSKLSVALPLDVCIASKLVVPLNCLQWGHNYVFSNQCVFISKC